MKRRDFICLPVCLTTCAVALVVPGAHAVNLGTIGPTYGIAEPHLLANIEQHLREKERSGELQRLIDEARVRGTESVRRPAAVEGLRATDAARTFYVDPSLTLDRNIVDAQGRLLFAAGTRKDPLEMVSLEVFGARGLDQRRPERPPQPFGVDRSSETWFHRYLFSFAGTISGATSEIQRNLIAERVLGLPRGARP